MVSGQEQLAKLREQIVLQRRKFDAGNAMLVWLPDYLGKNPNAERRTKLERLNYAIGSLRHPPHARLYKDTLTPGSIFFDPVEQELMALPDGEFAAAMKILERTPENLPRFLPPTRLRQKYDRVAHAVDGYSLLAYELGRFIFRRNRTHCEEVLSQIVAGPILDASPTDWCLAWMFEKPFATRTGRPDLGVAIPHAFDRMIECVEELSRDSASSSAKSKPRSRKLRINARMLETVELIPEALGWSAARWARYLRCVKSSVAETKAWKDWMLLRERIKAERARDRRRR